MAKDMIDHKDIDGRSESEGAAMSTQAKTAGVLTNGERQYIEAVISRAGGRRRFRSKACWKNANILMVNDEAKRLSYWEGYLDGCIPHAWVTINGKVVDVTQEAAVRKLKRMKLTPDAQRTYAGVSIDLLTVVRHAARTRWYSPVTNIDMVGTLPIAEIERRARQARTDESKWVRRRQWSQGRLRARRTTEA